MKRTSTTSLIVLVAIGGVVAVLLEIVLAGRGQPIVLPPATLAITLTAIAIILVVLARPIYRLARGKASQPVDPYYATRVLVLAKASALTGALIVGFGAGIVIYLLTRSVVPGVGSVGLAIATLVGAAVLLAAGLVAEFMCTIPPDDDDDDDENGTRAVRVLP